MQFVPASSMLIVFTSTMLTLSFVYCYKKNHSIKAGPSTWRQFDSEAVGSERMSQLILISLQ